MTWRMREVGWEARTVDGRRYRDIAGEMSYSDVWKRGVSSFRNRVVHIVGPSVYKKGARNRKYP